MDKFSYKEDQWYHREKLMLLLLRVIASLTLLIAGITLLALRIPGWGLILGLPMIIFGSVFIIYTYDEVLSRHVGHDHHPNENHESKDEDSEN